MLDPGVVRNYKIHRSEEKSGCRNYVINLKDHLDCNYPSIFVYLLFARSITTPRIPLRRRKGRPWRKNTGIYIYIRKGFEDGEEYWRKNIRRETEREEIEAIGSDRTSPRASHFYKLAPPSNDDHRAVARRPAISRSRFSPRFRRSLSAV